MSPGSDAKAHMAAAEQALKTSWVGLKFSPDHLTSSLEYAQAATKFRAANMLEEAVIAWVRSAEMKEILRDQFAAGRAYESAGAICDGKGPGGHSAAAEHWRKAIHCFRLCGKAEIAGKLVLKLAEASEKQGDIETAQAAYVQALEVYQDEEKDYNLGDIYKQYIGFLVRAEKWDAAQKAIDGYVELLVRQKHYPFAHKELLSKVVLHLNRPDLVLAEQALSPHIEVEGWFMSKESQLASELLAAYQENDPDASERVLKEQTFGFLNVEVARIARKLRIPRVAVAPRPPTSAHAPTSAGAADAAAGVGAPSGGATADDLAELLM